MSESTPLTETQALTLLRGMIAALSGIALASVLRADTTGERPTGDVIVYRVLAETPLGRGSQVGGAWQVLYEVDVLIEAYGATAVDRMTALRALLTSDAPARKAFVTQGLSVGEVSGVTNRTGLLDNTWEPRADLTATVRYVLAATTAAQTLAASVELDVNDQAVATFTLIEESP